MNEILFWALCSATAYVHMTSVNWATHGDVLGFRRSDRRFALTMSVAGPFGLASSLLAGMWVYGLRGVFPRPALIWSPKPPRDARYLDCWSPDE